MSYNMNEFWKEAGTSFTDEDRAINKLQDEESKVCFDWARRKAFEIWNNSKRNDIYILSFDLGKIYGNHVAVYLKDDNLFIDNPTWKKWHDERKDVQFNSAYKVEEGKINPENKISDLNKNDIYQAEVKYFDR